jgi:hypothetical protein
MLKSVLAAALGAFAALAPANAEDFLLSGAAEEVVQVHLTTGEEAFIGPFASVSKACGSLGSAKTQILQQPQHGFVAVARQRGAIAFSDDSPNAHCNDKPIVGAVVRYTPHDGFVGTDVFAFRVVFRDGETRTKWVNVDVRCGGSAQARAATAL